MPATKRTKPKGSIWIAQVKLAYEIIAAGHTKQEAVDAAAKAAARWLKDRGGEQPLGPWTAERVKDYFGVGATLVPIGGAVVT